jgi:pSer/pThr/pTyr-binding forkhead associated (FHA) protein
MEDSARRITMILYILNEGDVKEPKDKWDIIPNKLYTIGRSKKESNLPIDEKLLSRKHAELIYYHAKKIMVRDLDSRNGTYINKKRIEPLKDTYFTIKDRLSLGNENSEIVFIDGKEEAKSKDSELEKKERINNDINKSYNSNYYPNDNKRSYFGLDTYPTRLRERSRSRETYRDQERPRSRNYSRERENSYKRSTRNYIEKEYQKMEFDDNNRRNTYENEKTSMGKSFERYRELERRENSKKSERRERREEYLKEMRDRDRDQDRERERERYRDDVGINSLYRRSKRNNDNEDEFSRDRIVLNIDKNKRIEEQLRNIPEDVGYIKCYVSGYMILNVKK